MTFDPYRVSEEYGELVDELEDLADKWRRQSKAYPGHGQGQAAAGAVQLCAQELEDKLEELTDEQA